MIMTAVKINKKRIYMEMVLKMHITSEVKLKMTVQNRYNFSAVF